MRTARLRILRPTKLATCVSVALAFSSGAALAAEQVSANVSTTFKKYCMGCHSKANAMGGINLQQLTSEVSIGKHYQQWQKVILALEEKHMPPPKMPQPTEDQRSEAVSWIRSTSNDYIAKTAGDPGRVTVRRLTSGEYAHTVRDLTGLDLRFDAEFASDTVGGEGFTNFGDAQFMADANLERYLESAKKIADHAVIGAGPVSFFDDPGKSGFEISAITRIRKIYQENGFRANSGEGGKPYGLEKYTGAYFVCWQYQHRAALGSPKATIESIAKKEGVSPRFAKHIWSVMHEKNPRFPTSLLASKFRSLPRPVKGNRVKSLEVGRKGAADMMDATIEWPRWLLAAGQEAEGGAGDERALVLNEETLQVAHKHTYKYPVRIDKEKNNSRIHVFIDPATVTPLGKSAVLWRNPTVRIRAKDRALGPVQPLKAILDESTVQKLGFGKEFEGTTVNPEDFVSNSSFILDLPLPEGSFGADLVMNAELVGPGDAIIRCVLSDKADITKGRPSWSLLGNPESVAYKSWKSDVLDFTAKLPQGSQGEATPADKDPIPAPFLNVYNQPERDYYHAKVKYYRTDRFLVEKMLDDMTRQQLDEAWNDLLASFEYHDLYMGFVAKKYKLDLKAKTIAELDEAQIAAIPEEPRQFIAALYKEYHAVQKAQLAAQPRHVNDALEFAEQAWRRPLSPAEKDRLRSFYVNAREKDKLDHGKAIEMLLARVLISPAFLYRLETPSAEPGVKALSDWEVASRLSYFLWSSIPDEELLRAARANELSDPEKLKQQVKRMLADSRSRRFATEFFGQWLGFYRFDDYKGVDTKRFPEFTEDVKSAMYDEAVSFFEYVVRKDKPVRDILHADYTFMNQTLAKHYGIQKELPAGDKVHLVEGANGVHRGGLLRMGAILTATSAPLRTSPVKRGDWMLRRILNTPTPPPPPDAGSLPADDKQFGGLSAKERLASHMRNATCAGCHMRIDPLGFPFEKYDSVGRWRETYSDGKAVEDFSDLADKTRIAGIDGLLSYLDKQQPQVTRTLSGKLIGYALGRTVQASDQPLIDGIVKMGGNVPFSKLIEEIVLSRQFRYRREPEESSLPAEGQQTAFVPAVKNTLQGERQNEEQE